MKNLVKIDTKYPQKRLIKKIEEILKNDGVIIYPTDTVYGMGCDIYSKKALEKIYQIKKAHRRKLLSILCSDLKDISQYAKVSNVAYRIMKRIFPGPYTVILQATRMVPKIMLTKRKTIGIRMPNNEFCLSLVRELGNPIINTSASVSDNELLSDPEEIEAKFGPYVDMIIDGGLLISEPSTIVDLTEDLPKILREGKGEISNI